MTTESHFIRTYWYEKGIEHGNPKYNSRFRVNAPETSLNPSFMYRSEARENGMMLIPIEEDLAMLDEAILYLETWGGHPGTTNKRVTINGRITYMLPEVGTADNNCTHSYPFIPLKITDLVNGHNAIQFSCDKGNTFWGHFIVDNACLISVLKDHHPDIENAGLGDFKASVLANPLSENKNIHLTLSCQHENLDKVSYVDYIGYYNSYDENGNGKNLDWHFFTKEGKPMAIMGTAYKPPFGISWDTSMIPEQNDMKVLALIHFKDLPNMVYISSITQGLSTPEKGKSLVKLYSSEDLPKPFWSRANKKSKCTIQLDIGPEKIQKAELHIVIWDGGRGNVENPFTLNGHPISITGNGKHDVMYVKTEIPKAFISKGSNEIELLSDTEHHGIEVLLPGPAFMLSLTK